jgi:hypothetical protein
LPITPYNSPLLTSIVPENLNDFGEEKLIIRIWYEGTDREADQALGGGQVKVNLKFVGMNEKLYPTSETENLLKNITAVKTDDQYSFENVPDGTLYSLNGYDWKEYSQDRNTNINSYLNIQNKDCKIYFKTKETDLYYECMHSILLEYEGENNNEN